MKSRPFVKDATNSGCKKLPQQLFFLTTVSADSPQPYVLYSIKEPDIHSMTGWRHTRKRVPVAGHPAFKAFVSPLDKPPGQKANLLRPLRDSASTALVPSRPSGAYHPSSRSFQSLSERKMKASSGRRKLQACDRELDDSVARGK